jgi:hypothetical protein
MLAVAGTSHRSAASVKRKHAHRAYDARPRRVAAPYRSPYLDAADPNSIPLETPAPVRYERSHSFVARLFGLRHRVVDTPATPAPAQTTPG